MDGFRVLVCSLCLLGSACPAPEPDLVLTPEVPVWEQGNAPKVFRARIVDKLGRKITATLSYKRRAVEQDRVWSGKPSVTEQNIFEFVLPEDHRPETFLRTQTVDYGWSATARDDDGTTESDDVWNTFQVGCGDDGPAWWMAEQDRWVSSLDGLNLPELALRGYIPSHGPVAFAGLGLTFVKPDPMYGEPDLLFYIPDVGDMRLAGWGYVSPYDPALWPTKGCIPFESWFVHEQGWHLVDGTFVPSPRGFATPPAPGAVWHPRLWDVHLWRRDGQPPLIAVSDPTLMQDAPQVPNGTFFFTSWQLP